MWVFWVVNFEIVVIMCAVKMFCCRMGDESCKDVNEMCSPIICPRTEKGRKQRSLCIKSELDVSPPRTSSVCIGDTPRVCVGKGEKLRSNREKASVFSPIAPRFSELSRGFSEKRPFVRPEDGQRRPEVGKKGKYCADCATNCPGASEQTRREGQEKSKARAVAGFALKKEGELPDRDPRERTANAAVPFQNGRREVRPGRVRAPNAGDAGQQGGMLSRPIEEQKNEGRAARLFA